MTNKARKNKPTRIEKKHNKNKEIELLRKPFNDHYLNNKHPVTFADLQEAFPEIPREELEEALSHWVMRPGARVLSTKTTDLDGHELQVWYVHGLHEEQADLEDSMSRSAVQA